ncbi:methyltransferase domain-containing protein [Methyloligella sp. 2.7D]|uniref:methyltransferase domain-containing protein n=1 Tax=unclassified Methyloligella TaxID=2625955 RepID=UPI00157CC558|nr:methyltransferase domain-containing protein [Methyloligella sp. GL2]QKP76597.1 methyltransferase domain-containing protein [Methyloligella sp. GL2]
MTDQARLFDRPLLRRRRDRFAAKFRHHDFLFAHCAEEIAGRLQAVLHEFPLCLDLGAHRGDLGRAVSALPNIGQVIYGELSEVLARHCPSPAVVCDEECLPFADASLDLVVSGLSLHHVNDLPGALIQIRRALKPDGLFLAAMLGGATLSELREALLIAESEEGGASPRVAPFADIREAGALLQRSGFALPVADTESLTVSYRSLRDLLNEIRGMGAANVLLERKRAPLLRRTLNRAEAIYRERFGLSDGRIPATFEIVYLSGWSPAPGQQKPLRPGSAQHRLADALHTEESAAGDKAGFPRRKLDKEE